jgi:hypothetical protein
MSEFYIEKRGGVSILVYPDGACRPASMVEALQDADNAALCEKVERAKDALREIREIYAGMDGFIPETAPEGYQQRIIKQMYDAAVRALDEAMI